MEASNLTENVKMDQESALKLFEEGAVFVLLDVPVGTEFGIDLNSWNTGEKFKGIKMIPPGLHFVYYSAASKEGHLAPRTGFFHNFQKKEVLVRQYNQSEEDISDSVDEEVKERLQMNLKELDKNLGPYPFQSWKKWVSLSNNLTVEVIDRLEPTGKKIAAVADLLPGEAEQTSIEPEIKKRKRILRANIEESLLPTMHQRPGTELRFTKIPETSFPEDATASDITRYSIDTSYSLGQLILKWDRPEQLLGELQMAFLCFLVGQVYTAFEQWKKLVHLFCSADELLLKEPQLFVDFIAVFYFQMQEVPGDFFVDIVSQDNFLTHTLRIFFSNVLENERLDKHLRKRAAQLQQYLTHRFQWDFSADLDDDAPVIVELEEDAPVIVELDGEEANVHVDDA